MADISVKIISQEALGNFWRQKDLILSRSLQKGLHYAMEGYVQNVKLDMMDDKLKLEARIYHNARGRSIISRSSRLQITTSHTSIVHAPQGKIKLIYLQLIQLIWRGTEM